MRSTTAVAVSLLLLLACKGKEETSQSLAGRASVERVVTASAPAAMDMAKQTGLMDDVQLAAPPSTPAPPNRIGGSGATADVSPSMLIRTGSASIEVSKLDPAIIAVRQLASRLGGYVANSSISGGRDQIRSATLELKVPAAKYDQAVSDIGNIGKVESVNTTAEDVGEEYVDITARVTNSKRLEERLVTLLSKRTGKLEDVLAVERELARVREEIERYEGRLRFLRTRAAVSTLSVTIHEPFPILGQRPGENPIASAVKQAWRNFVGFIAWLIASIGVLVPAGGLLALGWYIFKRARMKRV
jgi:hypothetical protein